MAEAQVGHTKGATVMDVSVTPMQLGLVGMTLMIVWKLLDVAKNIFLARVADIRPADTPSKTTNGIIKDAEHQRKADNMADTIRKWDKMVDSGAFSCAWKGRDEVRDLLETMRALRATQQELVTINRQLVAELRMRRNGGEF